MSNPKQAAWETMEAGRALDVMVVQRMGWQIGFNKDNLKQEYLVYPDKSTWPLPPGVDAWRYLMTTEAIPHYSTDLNAAFVLFGSELGLQWNLFSDFDDWITCELGHWSETGHIDEQVQASEKTPALAIVKAWLRWQQRTDHPTPEYPKGKES